MIAFQVILLNMFSTSESSFSDPFMLQWRSINQTITLVFFHLYCAFHHQASPRSGKLYLELDVANKRVLIQGEAVTIMSGTLFA